MVQTQTRGGREEEERRKRRKRGGRGGREEELGAHLGCLLKVPLGGVDNVDNGATLGNLVSGNKKSLKLTRAEMSAQRRLASSTLRSPATADQLIHVASSS